MLDYGNSSTIYLSQRDGNDHLSGFSPVKSVAGAGPVRSMARVMDLLWNMRACGARQPVTVKIMGDYYLEEPINVGFEYANSFFSRSHKMRNVTFEPYGKERVKIVGGRRLTGFAKDTITLRRVWELHLTAVFRGVTPCL